MAIRTASMDKMLKLHHCQSMYYVYYCSNFDIVVHFQHLDWQCIFNIGYQQYRW